MKAADLHEVATFQLESRLLRKWSQPGCSTGVKLRHSRFCKDSEIKEVLCITVAGIRYPKTYVAKSVQGRSSWKPNQRSNGFCQVCHGITQFKNTISIKIALPENLWLETQNGGLEANFPVQGSGFQVPSWFSQE